MGLGLKSGVFGAAEVFWGSFGEFGWLRFLNCNERGFGVGD
jgi:hypothetical protein